MCHKTLPGLDLTFYTARESILFIDAEQMDEYIKGSIDLIMKRYLKTLLYLTNNHFLQ